MRGWEHGAPTAPRPWWSAALAAFCLASALFLAARDLFVPAVRDVEVWFGLELRGDAALLTAPLHWALFLVGAWAFWRRLSWILPAAAGYAFYVAASHLVWNVTSPRGGGWAAGVVQAVLFAIPGLVLLGAHRSAQRRRGLHSRARVE